MQQSTIKLTGRSPFGRDFIRKMGNHWIVNSITAHVLFSQHPGPWMLLEHDHFQRWVNLSADQHFLVRWDGWKNE
ncbi:hypothetical protein D8Y20_05105 [Mariprofundus sp. EBB-1]|uniref:hypothetical protein n=1 Tax=Mariprofundus sp. EBB-1 TaxID=2650971 RepID=UPI000EF19624|nr:hypothetical protein [Mariprofundus sp. EBB-1]RLL53550.1 hypothetical protein D8Y20_05105 [Mariprofundus sp. EBB-1]